MTDDQMQPAPDRPKPDSDSALEPASKSVSAADWEALAPGAEEVYNVELPVFEGPLDLLLHLIRKHEIDIFDIPIALITEKYLSYLEWMRVLDLDIAGEFIVMASTLALIKSKMLLPPEQSQGDEDDAEELDPREELVRRLLEYQRYKEAADELRDHPVLNRDVFCRGGRTPSSDSDSPFAEVSVFRLIESLERVMKKVKDKLTHDVVMDRVSIADRILELVEILQEKPEVVFDDLFEGVKTRMAVVATFLAILEMARLRMIRIHQTEDSEVIHVRGVLDSLASSDVLSNSKLEVE